MHWHKALQDWGADLIVGTHPHVLQNAQWLTAADGRKVFTAYSLGNFISTQAKPDQLVGALLTVKLEKTTEPDGSVHCTVLVPRLCRCNALRRGKSNVQHLSASGTITAALAQAHGVRNDYPDFSLEWIRTVIPEKHRPGIFAAYLSEFYVVEARFSAERMFFMYGVSKISIETSLMMISVQDVEFKGNSLARVFADFCG